MDISMCGDDINIVNNDLVLMSPVDAVDMVFKRSIITPLGYIAMVVRDRLGVYVRDAYYGDNIYSELSEPLTGAWYGRIRADILTSVAFLGATATIIDLTINANNLSQVDIYLSYQLTVNGITSSNNISQTVSL